MPPRSSAWRRPPRRRAYEEILQVRFAGRRETEVAADLARLLRRFGHSQVDFTVVGSGPNGANPHHAIGERVIEDGDMVVLDFGGLKYGYGSDTTRTMHVGEAIDEEREVHEIVCRPQQAAFDAVRPGMCFSVEPGIYLSGRFGVRIEDIDTVTPDGSGRRLNQTPHEMQIVSWRAPPDRRRLTR
jgi:Xaa-Pro aminopeptidase